MKIEDIDFSFEIKPSPAIEALTEAWRAASVRTAPLSSGSGSPIRMLSVDRWPYGTVLTLPHGTVKVMWIGGGKVVGTRHGEIFDLPGPDQSAWQPVPETDP